MLGPVAAEFATQVAIDKAREHGVATVTLPATLDAWVLIL